MRARRSLSLGLGAVLVLSLAAPVAAAAVAPDRKPGASSASPPGKGDLVRRNAFGYVESTSSPAGLTKPSKAPAEDIALAYAKASGGDFGLGSGAAKTLVVSKAQRLMTGATAVHVGQRVEGLRVTDAVLTVVVSPDGRVMSASGRLAKGTTSRGPSAGLTARQALDVSAAKQGAKPDRPLREADVRSTGKKTFPNVYGQGSASERPVTAELAWYPSADGQSLRLAWVTDIESSGQQWWESVVDADTGAVLERTSRYAHAGPEGTVWREQHPEAAGATRQVTAFTGLDGSWVNGTTTSGNNVNAYLDRNDDDANNEYQPQTPASGDPGYQHFNYAFGDTWRSTADVDSLAALDADRDAAITQLFYYTNVMHDWLYGHGFDEASGNFQIDNYGRGGSGNDPVLAEAQDGWDFGCVDQRGALGEGWSDVISYLKWGDAVIGEYVTGNASTGIRSVAYNASNLDFQDYDVNASSGHGPGQIWASALYDIRDQLPGGVEAMASLVLDGMKATTANPTFLQARDGLLAADGNANRCLIWSAFAGRGLGTGSTGSLDTVPTFSEDIPAQCLPTADAGGPYVTPEGTDVSLDGTGSAAGSDPSAGAIATYEWDLDNDGAYDDATGANPTFSTVGQDGVFPIGLRVTDAFGNTATATSQVTVTNVAPTVSITAITAIDEGGTVTVSGTVTDPGWLDPLTATISFDDGASPVALAGTLENVRPNATLTFSVDHQYGDDGAFTVQVCAADDDTTGNCDSEVATVGNIDPTAVIDTSGEQVYDGVSAFILEAGENLTVPVGSVDPGSDDLTAKWAWGDGSSDTQTSLVNPPGTDPAKSPSNQPRDVDFSKTHAYVDACAYTLDVTVTDDDLGSAADSALVLITGNADVSKGHGWWLNQYRTKAPNDFTPAELQCYLDIVGALSMVFDEKTDASTRAKATKVLNSPAKSPANVIFDQQLLGAWLNFANGSVKLATPVDTDGNGSKDSTFGAAVFTAESVRINPASSSAQIKAQKDIIERVALQSGN